MRKHIDEIDPQICNAGYIVASKTSTVCMANAAAGTFDWDVQSSAFACVKACHLVAGGLINGTKYFDLICVFL